MSRSMRESLSPYDFMGVTPKALSRPEHCLLGSNHGCALDRCSSAKASQASAPIGPVAKASALTCAQAKASESMARRSWPSPEMSWKAAKKLAKKSRGKKQKPAKLALSRAFKANKKAMAAVTKAKKATKVGVCQPNRSHGPNWSHGANEPDWSHGTHKPDWSHGANEPDRTYRLHKPDRTDRTYRRHWPNRRRLLRALGAPVASTPAPSGVTAQLLAGVRPLWLSPRHHRVRSKPSVPAMATQISMVATGIRTDDTVSCWGSNVDDDYEGEYVGQTVLRRARSRQLMPAACIPAGSRPTTRLSVGVPTTGVSPRRRQARSRELAPTPRLPAGFD